VIAQALGYTTFNGASKAVITALKDYGLLEPAGDGLRISADAIRVLELPQGDPERTEALVRMVFAPSVFADLRTRYGELLPLNVRHALVTQEFAPPRPTRSSVFTAQISNSSERTAAMLASLALRPT
jgi:hypothetical protein